MAFYNMAVFPFPSCFLEFLASFFSFLLQYEDIKYSIVDRLVLGEKFPILCSIVVSVLETHTEFLKLHPKCHFITSYSPE